MRYILYARKSSESEDRQVQSIDDQLRVLREFAVRAKLNVVCELIEARSAKAPGTRPVFADLLGRIQRGEADAVLCWSINRLARNPVDSGQLSWMLQEGTLKSIRTVDREFLPEDNVLLMAVESGVANQYILDLRKAVIRGMEGKAARGWYPNRPPQGYRVNPETKEIEPVEPQFGLLRRAWDLLLSGAFNVTQIRQKLIDWGYPYPKRGSLGSRLFSESHLYRIFDNRFYCGTFTFRNQTFEGRHQAMVDPTEFEKAQLILHKGLTRQPRKHEFAFTGLIRCGGCGCFITAECKTKHYKTTDRTAAYEYYRCTRRRGPCHEPSVTGAFVEASIAEEVDKLSIDADFGRWLLDALERDWFETPEREANHVAKLEAQIQAGEQRVARLVELRVAGELESSEFAELRASAQEELLRLRTRLSAMTDREETVRKALVNAVRFSLDSKRRIAEDDPQIKRAVATTFGIRYVLTLGQLQITPHPLLARFSELEPPKPPRQRVGARALQPGAPLRWAFRDQIRTLIAGLSDEDLSFPDQTPFAPNADLPEVGRAA